MITKTLSDRYGERLKRWSFIDTVKYEQMIRFETMMIHRYNSSMSYGRKHKVYQRYSRNPNHYLSGGSVPITPCDEDMKLLHDFETEYSIPMTIRITNQFGYSNLGGGGFKCESFTFALNIREVLLRFKWYRDYINS